MLITRLAKILISLSLALFCLLVAFDNITDPASNYEFVTHVMSMDTTSPGNTLMYRSVTDPLIWRIVYALIIATQLACGGLFLAGAMRMWQMLTSSAYEFNRAKSFAIAGALLAFLLWFFVFMVIAGEWFAMWQSRDYNAQQASFRFYVTVLAALIFFNMPDSELNERTGR